MAVPEHKGDIPWLTVEQMLEVVRAMVEDYGIDLTRMSG